VAHAQAVARDIIAAGAWTQAAALNDPTGGDGRCHLFVVVVVAAAHVSKCKCEIVAQISLSNHQKSDNVQETLFNAQIASVTRRLPSVQSCRRERA
jgi:hypothetical protein